MKKKMKTNQDGGSVTASDPAAAGKQQPPLKQGLLRSLSNA